MTKTLPSRVKGKPLWKLRIVPRLRADGKELWGQCREDTREILITKSAERHGVDRQVFLHEMIHKICPWMDEEAVDEMASELDDALDVVGL